MSRCVRDAIDRHVRAVLGGDGPRLVSVSAIVASEKLRRVGNILRQFSSKHTQKTCGDIWAATSWVASCSEHQKTMWSVVEDVLSGRSVIDCSAALSEFAFQHGEYRVLTCDGTVGIALALKRYKRNIFRTSAAKAHTIFCKITTVLTRYRPIVLELIKNCNACNFTRRRFFWN